MHDFMTPKIGVQKINYYVLFLQWNLNNTIFGVKCNVCVLLTKY